MKNILQCLNLPTICPICQQANHSKQGLCSACRQLFHTIQQACPHCRLPQTHDETCGQCLHSPPHYARILCNYEYKPPMTGLITQFKYQQGLDLSLLLSQFIQASIHNFYQKSNMPQCLIPVPLHEKRLKERGFNQAVELCKRLSKDLNIPHEVHLCRRSKNTLSQARLPAKKRLTNLKKAFTVKAHDYQKVALVDDVVTTGSTVNELSRLIKRASPKCTVDVWCCARTSIL